MATKDKQALFRDPRLDPVPLTFRRRGWEALAQRLVVRGRLDLSVAIQSDLKASLWENPLQIWFESEDAFEVNTVAAQIAAEHGRAGRSRAPTAVHETVPHVEEDEP